MKHEAESGVPEVQEASHLQLALYLPHSTHTLLNTLQQIVDADVD
jgi:hypothetical protein